MQQLMNHSIFLLTQSNPEFLTPSYFMAACESMHAVTMQEVVIGSTLKRKLDRQFRSRIEILQTLL
jgi:hypothetical protein